MKIRKEQEHNFEQYFVGLSDPAQESVKKFFIEFEKHNMLPRDEKSAMKTDFEAALLYYADSGVSLDDALERLAIKNMGGFYSRPSILWYPLDDAAKIYPLSMRHGRMTVFRISAYLKEDVVPEILQMALSFTIKRFPGFATTVKKGFFWHYLDTAKRRYSIEPETDVPCRPLKVSGSGSQSFRIVHYRNRISAEYFHILTDGTGGLVFLKALLCEYFRLLGVDFSEVDNIIDINGEPSEEEVRNEFPNVKKTEKSSGFVDRPATQLSGRLSGRRPCGVLHLKMDADKLKAAADANNATVTAYMLSLMFIACKSAIDQLNGTVNIQVPVNMRKFYPSNTLRNFSMYCGIKLSIKDIQDMKIILPRINKQLKEKASKDAMDEMVNSAERMVNMMRYIPLVIKSPAAVIGYGFLGDRIFSNTLTNMGVVSFPKEMYSRIESMDLVLGSALSNRASCAMVTYNGIATLSVSKMTADPSFEEKLYSLLIAEDIPTVAEGSDLYEC